MLESEGNLRDSLVSITMVESEIEIVLDCIGVVVLVGRVEERAAGLHTRLIEGVGEEIAVG